MHYYQFNIGDYMRDTAHLDEMEDLAYRRMLDLYYLRESPLPDDVKEIAKLIRMRMHCECIANVLQEFFTLGDNGWFNAKADTVLTKIYDKSEKAKIAADKRWRKQPVKNANALQTQCQNDADGMLPNTYIPINTIPSTELKDLVDSEESPAVQKDYLQTEFDRFWRNYPTKKAKQSAQKAFVKLLKGKTPGKVKFNVDMILSYHTECIEREEIGADKLHAATLLNQKRWEDNPEFIEEFKQEWLKENANG
jgi:uncharacterized protein YdaU (DUF1376 family)